MRLVVAILAASLAGCAGWKHPTSSDADFNRDRYQCQSETAGNFPVTQTSMGPGYQAPSRTNCTAYGNQANCTTTPGAYVPAPMQDTNAMPRAFAFDSCMRARGYTR
jgi:hypothetical protein